MTNIEILLSKGYNKEMLIKMAIRNIQISNDKGNDINEFFEYLSKKGYSEKAVFIMIKQTPDVLKRSVKDLDDRFEYFLSKGFTNKQVIHMTSLAPELFVARKIVIDEKIDFYRQIKVDRALLDNPRKYRQSIDLTYARYECLKSKGYMLDCVNCGILFVNDYYFERKFGIKKQTLLDLYSYSDYVKAKRQNNRTLIRRSLENIAHKKKSQINKEGI